MSLLNWQTAAIAAGITIPTLLLLYFLKLRRTERPVASTLLWKKAVQDLQVNSPFQRLRRNLLLIIQMLLLFLLLAAFARPVTQGETATGELTVIMLDRSASMAAADGNAPRIERAKDQAKDLVDTIAGDARAMLITFDRSARVVHPLTDDKASLKRAIDDVYASQESGSLDLAYDLAGAQAVFDTGQNRPSILPQVHLFSDGRVPASSQLTLNGRLTFHQIGTADAENIAVVALSARRRYEEPTKVQVFARLANFGPQPVSCGVELSVAPIDQPGQAPNFVGSPVGGVVQLPPERWFDEQWVKANPGAVDTDYARRDSVEFELDLTTAAVIRLQHSNGPDALSVDDAAYVVVPPPRPLSVLLVTKGDWFLQQMITGLELEDSQVIAPEDFSPAIAQNFDVVILEATMPETLPEAGTFIVINAIPPGGDLKQMTTDAGLEVFAEGETVLDWDREHPVTRDLNLGALYVAQSRRLLLPLEAKTWVEGLSGPMIVEYTSGRRRFVVLSFDTVESSWPLQDPSYPIFWFNLLQYLSVGEDLSLNQSYQPGDVPTLPRPVVATTVQGDSFTLIGPAGETKIAVPERGDVVLSNLDRVGMYRTQPPISGFSQVAVNLLDSTESNLLPAESPPGGVGVEVTGEAESIKRVEWWWWLILCGALPMLLIEWWVYTRRIHA